MKRLVWFAAIVLGATWFLAPSADDPELLGLWRRADLEAGQLRFYYFHTGGHGLYRYGRDALNATASFDYEIDDDRIHLKFRKTGVEHDVRYTRQSDDRIVLHADPREGRDTTYNRVAPPISGSDHPFARMWTHTERYATGGYAFRIYQLQAPDADGAGHGWFHEGDFDDWTTEALSYRRHDGRIGLKFIERGDTHDTKLVEGHGERRTLSFERDPRGFWHRRTYVDGGRSFMADGLANDWSPPLQFGSWPSNR